MPKSFHFSVQIALVARIEDVLDIQVIVRIDWQLIVEKYLMPKSICCLASAKRLMTDCGPITSQPAS